MNEILWCVLVHVCKCMCVALYCNSSACRRRVKCFAGVFLFLCLRWDLPVLLLLLLYNLTWHRIFLCNLHFSDFIWSFFKQRCGLFAGRTCNIRLTSVKTVICCLKGGGFDAINHWFCNLFYLFSRFVKLGSLLLTNAFLQFFKKI